MLSMTAREKYAKAIKRMKALGCETPEEIIAGLENEIDRLRTDLLCLHTDLLCEKISNGTITVKKVHELKIQPEYYEAVVSGEKTFEVRKNDRGFITGDLLVLKEWNGETFTGRTIRKKISYMIAGVDGIMPGYCVLGIVDQELKKEKV